jgi:hypothetical protein
MIAISRKSTGAGIHKLSELEIDVDKDWSGYKIINMSGISDSSMLGFDLSVYRINLNLNGAVAYVECASDMGVEFTTFYGGIHLNSAQHETTIYGNGIDFVSDGFGRFICVGNVLLQSNEELDINANSRLVLSSYVEGVIFKMYAGGGQGIGELHFNYNTTDGVIDIWSNYPIRISNLVGGGGITKLSQLDIDADKNWAGHSITNFGNLSGSAIGISTDTGDITLSPGSGFIGIVDNRGLGYTDLYFGLDPNSFYINFFENVNVKGLYTQIIGDTTTYNYFEVYTETDYNGNTYWSDLSVGNGISITTDGKRTIFMASDNPNSGGIAFPEDTAFILFDKYLNLHVRSGYNLALGTGRTGMLHIESADNAYIEPSGDFWLEVVGNINIISRRGSYLKIELNDETSGITYGQLYFDNTGIKIQSHTDIDIILNAGGVVISNTDIDILNSSYGLILRDRAQAGKPYRLYVSNGVLNLEPI